MDGLRHPRYHGVGASCLLDTQHAMGGHGASVRHGRNWSNNLWALLLATRHVGMVAGGWRAHRCILSLGIPLPRRFRAAQRLLLRAANVTHPARCPCMGVISVGAACRLPLPHRVRDPHVLFPCSWPFPVRPTRPVRMCHACPCLPSQLTSQLMSSSHLPISTWVAAHAARASNTPPIPYSHVVAFCMIFVLDTPSLLLPFGVFLALLWFFPRIILTFAALLAIYMFLPLLRSAKAHLAKLVENPYGAGEPPERVKTGEQAVSVPRRYRAYGACTSVIRNNALAASPVLTRVCIVLTPSPTSRRLIWCSLGTIRPVRKRITTCSTRIAPLRSRNSSRATGG